MTVLSELPPDPFPNPADPASQDYPERELLDDPDAEGHKKEIVGIVIAALVAAKVFNWRELVDRWLDHGMSDEDYDATIGKALRTALKNGLAIKLADLVNMGVRLARPVPSIPPPISPDGWRRLVITWSDRYAATQAATWDLQSKRALKLIFPVLRDKGLSHDALTRQLKDSFGIDPQTATTYLAMLEREGRPKGNALKDWIELAVRRRVHLLADVAMVTGINTGRQLSWQTALEYGTLPKTAHKVWVTAADERVCPSCAPMDGVAVPVNAPFEVAVPGPKTARGKRRKSIEVMVPPLHPNCRCVQVLDTHFHGGVISRVARYLNQKSLGRELTRLITGF